MFKSVEYTNIDAENRFSWGCSVCAFLDAFCHHSNALDYFSPVTGVLLLTPPP